MTDEAPAPVILGPGEGRRWPMEAISATFKADAPGTSGRFAVSDWRLEPRREGPGAHSHAAAGEVFHVLEGVASLLVGEAWRRFPAGPTAAIPRGVRNEGPEPIRLLDIYMGAFEAMMPAIAARFAENLPKPL